MALREERLKVSLWLNDRPGNHSYIENQSRPCLGPNLYNPTDQDITVTVPAKKAVYLLGLFANEKYARVETELTDTHFTVRIPINAGSAAFNSAKPKS